MHRDLLFLQPLSYELCGGRGEHPWQDLIGLLYNRKLPATLVQCVEHDKTDEAGADENHARRLAMGGSVQNPLRVG